MKRKNFFKVGEFARICGTTKETLLHYDRKGLLKPKHIAENGYREYGAEQYFEFDLISLLKEGGATLEEIKRHRSDEKNSGYLHLIKGQVSRLKFKQEQIEHRLAILNQLLEISEESMLTQHDNIFFEKRNSQDVIFYQIDSEKMLNRKNSVECYSNYLLDNLNGNNIIDMPLGNVIPKEYAIKKQYKMCYFFRNNYKDDNTDRHEIESGNYACMFHYGNIKSHIDMFEYMIDELIKMRFKIASNIYIYDQISYVLVGTNSDFIAKYIVKIE